LSLANEPAADPPKRATLRDDLPEQLARLTPTERRILRLKALVGVATNKNDFLTLLNGSGVTAPVGGSWSYNLVNPILNRLLTLGLLKPDFSCLEPLRHALAIEMIAASMARYDIARFGSEVFRPSPRQADLLIVSGTVTKKMAPQVVRLWNQTPYHYVMRQSYMDPKVWVSLDPNDAATPSALSGVQSVDPAILEAMPEP